MKRLVTGSLAIAAGLGLIIVLQVQGHPISSRVMLALGIFFVGGGWTLRDGIRLRRELQK